MGTPDRDRLTATPEEAPTMRVPLLAKLTSLPVIAMGAALGMLVAGILAVIGGSYAHQVVHDQLAPQKISFPPAGSPALPADLKEYGGKQVLDGDSAKAFADKFIGVHLEEVAGGQTYSEVSAKAQAQPDNEQLAAQTQTLFRGETLRGLLLNAWGWSVVGTVALIAGWVLIGLGALLFLLPLLDLILNGPRRVTGPPAAM
jgi:hypothetical protein